MRWYAVNCKTTRNLLGPVQTHVYGQVCTNCAGNCYPDSFCCSSTKKCGKKGLNSWLDNRIFGLHLPTLLSSLHTVL